MIGLLIIYIVLVLALCTFLIINIKKEKRTFIFSLILLLSASNIGLGGAIENIRLTSKTDNTETLDKSETINKDTIVKYSKDTLFIYLERR